MVSVIVPVYNSEEYIAACMESVLQQTYKDWELIVVDDGSTDGSGHICDDYACRCSQVKVIHQPNAGRTAARASGVAAAQGDWVTFVDSDDRLPLDALEKLSAATDDETDIVLGNGYTLGLTPCPKTIAMEEFRHLAVRGEGNIGVPWGSLYRRCLLMAPLASLAPDNQKPLTPWVFDLPRHIVNGEDYLFWLRLVFLSEKPVHIVEQSVYDKGEEHTSNSFVWTADYCYELNELRKASIPAAFHSDYLSDMVSDRLVNMFSVAMWSPKREWANSQYYDELRSDMKAVGRELGTKEKLFLALPSRRLRKLYSFLSRNLKPVCHRSGSYMLFLLLTGFCMLLLNLMDVPTLSDDMIYRFMWNADSQDEVSVIGGIGDLFHSQWTHYCNVNGRLPVHLLAQSFFAFVPPVVLQVLNTLLFVLLIHLCTVFIGGNKRLFTATSIVFLLFVVINGFRTTMVWSLGAFNYLWVLVGVMALLLWLRHIKDEPLSLHHALLSPLALVAGWSHEALSLPLTAAFACFLFVNRRTLRRAVTPYLLWFLIGTALCFLSPGIIGRSTEGITLTSRLISAVLNCLTNIRVLWLLLILLIVLWRRDRLFLRRHLQENIYAYVALLVSFGITLLCGTSLERVAFFTDFIAMLLLLRVLCEKTRAVWQRRLTVVACFLMVVCYVPAYVVRHENRAMWQDMEQQMKAPGCELIAVDLPRKGENAVMDYFRNHYVNPSAEFGFYCSYMGFDATDINMRCAAKLYNKPRLTFLPADVVNRIKRDSTAFSGYETDENGNLYIWRLSNERPVRSVRFILNEEDMSSLHFYQRLMVYDGDVFELDDFHYETVQVCGKPYLVFTRPTTNVTRRIKDIEIGYE